MDLKPGSRWKSAVCDGEFVVVRPAKSPVSLEAGGHQVIPHAAERASDLVMSDAHADGASAGKRYADAETGLEVLCSKAGKGSLSIDGRPIGATEAKKLPSSD